MISTCIDPGFQHWLRGLNVSCRFERDRPAQGRVVSASARVSAKSSLFSRYLICSGLKQCPGVNLDLSSRHHARPTPTSIDLRRGGLDYRLHRGSFFSRRLPLSSIAGMGLHGCSLHRPTPVLAGVRGVKRGV